MCSSFAQKPDLKEHMKSVHEGKKPFLCIEIFYVSFQLGILCKAITTNSALKCFFILHELDCKEFSVLMVAESMCQAYFLHELNPCVLALHRNLTWKNICCKICDIRFTQSGILMDTYQQFMKEINLSNVIFVKERNLTVFLKTHTSSWWQKEAIPMWQLWL